MPITINGSGTVTGITAGGLPDAIITQPELANGVAGTGPAFSAYPSGTQTLSSGTNTKILFGTEDFDTNSCFASSTFTPTVAGYYQVSAGVRAGAASTGIRTMIWKNGTTWKIGTDVNVNSDSGLVSTLVYCNGTTDYVEVYALLTSGQILSVSATATWFNGAMVRAA